MRGVRAFWRSMFDIREGEVRRTLFIALYLFFVLVCHYIMKPISRGMFLEKFDMDKLPFLYLLLAAAGGTLATLYTRAAIRASLDTAVRLVMGGAALFCILFWLAFLYNLQQKWNWLLYAFNIWADLFGVVVVAQGWLVAANVFTTREARRVYGVIGLGAAVGGLSGSFITSILVTRVGERSMILVCAALVALAYVSFRIAVAGKLGTLATARAAAEEETHVHVRDMLASIGRHRHLQVIIGIVTLIFIVDILVDYQFNSLADQQQSGTIGAFLARFRFYANALTFGLQFFVTAAMVSRIGVGGTMQIMPVAIGLASLGILIAPAGWTILIAALAERGSRYSFNRTGMELLYMPLPRDLRNRTKAFVDIAVDRTGRGMAAVMLMILGVFGLREPRQISAVVIALTLLWIVLSRLAQKEYIATVRKRLETRRLELESARVAVSDPATLAMLEQAAAGSNARQACYALTVLADAPGYDLPALLRRLVSSPLAQVRARVYELARSLKVPDLKEPALAEIQADGYAAGAAIAYVLAVSPDAPAYATSLLNDPRAAIAERAVEAIGGMGEAGRELIGYEWVKENAASTEPVRRRLAALAVGVRGDQGIECLHRLLADRDPGVVRAACRAAGMLKNRAYLHAVIRLLGEARVRGAAIEALAAFGTRIAGTLGDVLEDDTVPAGIRRQIPRVLRHVRDQRSVDVLLRSIGHPELSVRAAVLKALNRLREETPELDYGATFVTRQIFREARYYFELHAALEPLRKQQKPRTASALLARTIEERLTQTVERLFRLLGLRYPPKEIYAAYLALKHRRAEELSAALEFLENLLDRELKRTLLPLLDSPAHLNDRGRELFGIEIRSVESAIHELIRSGDPWLSACAIAAAAELGLRTLMPDIEHAAANSAKEISEVAMAAVAALG